MASMCTRKYFIVLYVLFICIVGTTGQCYPVNVQLTPVTYSTYRVSWECRDPGKSSELQVVYTLINKDGCNADDQLNMQQQSTEWGQWNCQAVEGLNARYSYWIDVTGLYPYSTYNYFVQSRVFYSSINDYLYDQTNVVSFITGKAAPIDSPTGIMNVIGQNTATSLTFQFNAIPCGDRRGATRYKFEVRDFDTGPDEVISSARFQYTQEDALLPDLVLVTIDGLQCGIYAFRVRGSNHDANDMMDGSLDGPYSGSFTGVTVCDINECASGPCVNGMCQDGLNQYMCQCDAGWTGTNCDVNINECASGPCVNGMCQDGLNQYMCQCDAGWTGTNCDVNINECASDPCVNGVCQDKINQYVCQCNAGWTGTNCDININGCGSIPCVNGACQNRTNQYVCQCDDGWTGTNCDITCLASNLMIEALSPTELKVSWETSTDSCRDISEYFVDYRLTNRDQCQPLDANEEEAIAVSLSGTFTTLPNLFPHSTYEIRVSDGDTEATMFGMTKETEPSGTPTDIKATSTNTTITLSWNQPLCTERNGNITSYTYDIFKTESSAFIAEDVVTSDTSIIVNNLETATEYSLIILANTKIGAGPKAVFQTQTLHKKATAAEVNSGLVVGSVIGVIVIVVIIAIVGIVIYRVRKSREENNDSPYEVNISPSKSMEMSSRNLGYQQDKDQRISSDDYENPEPQRAQSEYYEDLDKKTMSKEQEYQSLAKDGEKTEAKQPRYQNVTMTGKTQSSTHVPVDEFDYEVAGPAERKRSSGLYEDLNKETMDSKD
ncbi:uncharacterized protein [Amphiura filiformis]|uniref:uncharacterized protein n=1 Tax=Amphiura filiformis TaxID=82378 RepID=UPI003B20D090